LWEACLAMFQCGHGLWNTQAHLSCREELSGDVYLCHVCLCICGRPALQCFSVAMVFGTHKLICPLERNCQVMFTYVMNVMCACVFVGGLPCNVSVWPWSWKLEHTSSFVLQPYRSMA
jgi:hypothetical protein